MQGVVCTRDSSASLEQSGTEISYWRLPILNESPSTPQQSRRTSARILSDVLANGAIEDQ